MLAWRSRIMAQLQLQDPERRDLLRIAARHWQAQASAAAEREAAAADQTGGQPASAEAAACKGDTGEAGADQEGKPLPAEQAAEAAAEVPTDMDFEPAGRQQAAAPALTGPADRATAWSETLEAGGAWQRPSGARDGEAPPLAVGAEATAVAGHAQEQGSLQRPTSQAAHGSTATALGAQRSTTCPQQGGNAFKAAALTAQQKLQLGRLEQALQAKLQVILSSSCFLLQEHCRQAFFRFV